MNRDKSKKIFKRALNVMAKGVSSNFRYWGPNDTPVLVKGKGAKIWDADGNEFIDYRLGWGPIILGHADERVNRKVTEAIQEGITFAATSEREVIVAEKIVKMIPGMEMLRFTNTGTEATMHALRTARGYTDRECFIKFEGAYHGAHDYVLFSTASSPFEVMGSAYSPVAVQVGSGIPERLRDYVYTIPFNDFEIVQNTVEDNYGSIAAMIVEPCLGNIAGLEPNDGYLQHLRKLCDEYGIVLIFDEVKTGFRLSNGGARETYGVIPDISTYAKSLGNGFPVAAFGGKKDVMEVIGPGSVSHAGTFGGNGVSMAAAEAVLDILAETPVLKNIADKGMRLKRGLDDILTKAGIPHQLTGHPSMQGFLLTDTPVQDYRGFVNHNDRMYNKILTHLYKNGVFPEDNAREPWFLCAAHTEEIIDETLNKFADAVKAVIK